MTITMTEAATGEVKNIKELQQLGDETFLRISILGGGCSGMQYALNFDDAFDDLSDTKYEFDGVSLATKKKFDPHFDGTLVDFIDGPASRGFMIDNPNFPKGGGCPGCGGH